MEVHFWVCLRVSILRVNPPDENVFVFKGFKKSSHARVF